MMAGTPWHDAMRCGVEEEIFEVEVQMHMQKQTLMLIRIRIGIETPAPAELPLSVTVLVSRHPEIAIWLCVNDEAANASNG